MHRFDIHQFEVLLSKYEMRCLAFHIEKFAFQNWNLDLIVAFQIEAFEFVHYDAIGYSDFNFKTTCHLANKS